MSHVQPTRRQPAPIWGPQRRMDITAPLRTVWWRPRGGSDGAARRNRARARGGAVDVGSRDSAATPRRWWLSARQQYVATRNRQRRITTRPVLLVHGFAGSKSHWSLVAQALQVPEASPSRQSPMRRSERRRRWPTGRRCGGDVVSNVCADLVGHSLGGVIIAQAIADPRLNGRVDTVVTLGAPFGGSPWAGLLPFFEIVRALRLGSPLCPARLHAIA